jgi:hypothetical protein
VLVGAIVSNHAADDGFDELILDLSFLKSKEIRVRKYIRLSKGENNKCRKIRYGVLPPIINTV